MRKLQTCATAFALPLSLLWERGLGGEGQTRLRKAQTCAAKPCRASFQLAPPCPETQAALRMRKLQTCATAFVGQDCILPYLTRKAAPQVRKLQTCATAFVGQDCILPYLTRKAKPQVRKLQTCATAFALPLSRMGEGG